MGVADYNSVTTYLGLSRSEHVIVKAITKLKESFGDDPRLSEQDLLDNLHNIRNWLDSLARDHANDEFGTEVRHWVQLK